MKYAIYLLLFGILFASESPADSAKIQARSPNALKYDVLRNQHGHVVVEERLQEWFIEYQSVSLVLPRRLCVYQCIESPDSSLCVLLVMKRNLDDGVGLWFDKIINLQLDTNGIKIREILNAQDLSELKTRRSIVKLLELRNDGNLRFILSSYPISGGPTIREERWGNLLDLREIGISASRVVVEEVSK